MYYLEMGSDLCSLRFTHVYGSKQKLAPVQKAIPTFIYRAYKNRPIPIFGSGKQLMDCIHVDDAVRMLWGASQHDLAGKVFEVGSGEGITVADLAQRVVDITGTEAKLEILDMRPGEPDQSDSFKPADLTQVKGLMPELYADGLISLEDGLARTVSEYYDKWDKTDPGI